MSADGPKPKKNDVGFRAAIEGLADISGSKATADFDPTASMFFLECTIGPSWSVPMDVGGKCGFYAKVICELGVHQRSIS